MPPGSAAGLASAGSGSAGSGGCSGSGGVPGLGSDTTSGVSAAVSSAVSVVWVSSSAMIGSRLLLRHRAADQLLPRRIHPASIMPSLGIFLPLDEKSTETGRLRNEKLLAEFLALQGRHGLIEHPLKRRESRWRIDLRDIACDIGRHFDRHDQVFTERAGEGQSQRPIFSHLSALAVFAVARSFTLALSRAISIRCRSTSISAAADACLMRNSPSARDC